MLRFECGKHSNDGFKITNAETGEDLTDKILCTKLDILLSTRPQESNKARMEVYADSVDVLIDHVDVKVLQLGEEGETATIWKDYDIEVLSDRMENLEKHLRRIVDRSDQIVDAMRAISDFIKARAEASFKVTN